MSLQCLFSRRNVVQPWGQGRLVKFDYEHQGRRMATVVVDIVTQQIEYTSFGGLKHEWHGVASERNRFPSYVNKPFHEISFWGFSSHYGLCTQLLFQQVGVDCWKAFHPRSQDPIYMILKRVDLVHRMYLAAPAGMAPEILALDDRVDTEENTDAVAVVATGWTMMERR